MLRRRLFLGITASNMSGPKSFSPPFFSYYIISFVSSFFSSPPISCFPALNRSSKTSGVWLLLPFLFTVQFCLKVSYSAVKRKKHKKSLALLSSLMINQLRMLLIFLLNQSASGATQSINFECYSFNRRIC